MEECSLYSWQDNLSKCCKCNDAPGDFILESCLHNICNYCIASCLEIRDIYNCPKCLTKSRISINIFLPILGRQPVKNCSWCEVGNEKNSANGYCNECDANLCSECIKGHCRMPQFRSHYVKIKNETVGKTLRNCDSHPNEALDIYCETCEKLTCRDCQLSLHKEHKHQWIGEKAKEMETSLSGLKGKLTEKLSEINDLSISVVSNKESLVSNVKLAEQDLRNYIVQFQRVQQQFFEKMETELHDEAKCREHKLVEIAHEITKAKESVQHCMNLLNRISSSNEPSILIQVTPKLLKYIGLIIDRLENDNSTLQPFLDLEYSESRFIASKSPTQVLDQIGCTRFGNAMDTQLLKIESKLESIADDYRSSDEPDGASSGAVVHPLVGDPYGPGGDEWGDIGDLGLGAGGGGGDHQWCCSVCNEPGLVVCCSSCELLFHQACHVPRLSQLPSAGDWLCTVCGNPRKCVLEPADRSLPHKGRLNKKERKVVARIFLEILQFQDWTLFVVPDDSTHGGHGNTSDIDLDKVRFNIENKIYTSIDRFVADLKQIFQQAQNRYYQNRRLFVRVMRFKLFLDSLLHKYIPSELALQYDHTGDI